jgi:hypothetical protein
MPTSKILANVRFSLSMSERRRPARVPTVLCSVRSIASEKSQFAGKVVKIALIAPISDKEILFEIRNPRLIVCP